MKITKTLMIFILLLLIQFSGIFYCYYGEHFFVINFFSRNNFHLIFENNTICRNLFIKWLLYRTDCISTSCACILACVGFLST